MVSGCVDPVRVRRFQEKIKNWLSWQGVTFFIAILAAYSLEPGFL